MVDKKLKITYKNITDLKEAGYNPRKIDKDAFEQLKKSLSNFECVEPAVININPERFGTIVGGHQRIKVAKDLKWTEFPCVEVNLTLEQEKELNIRLNKNTGEFDFELLQEHFDTSDLVDWGFDEDEFEHEVEEVGEVEGEDDVPEPPEEPITVLGDVWILGEHRLVCGDSTSITDVDKLMDGNKADMVFTDPPYNVGFNGRSGKHDVIKNDDLSDSDFADFIDGTIATIKAVNPEHYYIWCNWDFFGILHGKMEYKSCIVWAKNNFGMGVGYRHQHEFCLFNGKVDEKIKNESDLWEIAKDTNYVHPTQKPVALSERALKNHKGAKNILDLFGGSGSTLIGCEKTKRKCFMMELDEKYCDVIIKRFIEFSGKDVFLLAGGEKIPYDVITSERQKGHEKENRK